MRPVLDLLKEARETRDLASRARRMAQGISDPAEKARVQSYVEELLKRAAKLEEEAAARKRATLF